MLGGRARGLEGCVPHTYLIYINYYGNIVLNLQDSLFKLCFQEHNPAYK